MAQPFTNFINNCNREQLIHFAIRELNPYELIDLVKDQNVTPLTPVKMSPSLIQEITANYDVFKDSLADQILIRMANVPDELIISTLCGLERNRQNAIMEDNYDDGLNVE